MGFSNNVVIVTGASSGIGKAIALQLAEQKAFLVLAARDFARLEEVAALCREAGAQAVPVQTDVSDKRQCEALIQRAIQEFGRIDTLINNAGSTMWARFDEVTDPSLLEPIMQVNYFGSVYCTWYALPYLKQSKGRIVGISSLAGRAGVPTRSGYAASKHAMAGFFDSLRIELADSGVSVTMVYPGFVTSEVRSRAIGPDGKPLGASPVQEGKVMSAETCARITLRAAAARKREVVMTFRGKLGIVLKLLAPSLLDKIAKKAIEKGK
jgi:short-subunit dehydrogenase